MDPIWRRASMFGRCSGRCACPCMRTDDVAVTSMGASFFFMQRFADACASFPNVVITQLEQGTGENQDAGGGVFSSLKRRSLETRGAVEVEHRRTLS